MKCFPRSLSTSPGHEHNHARHCITSGISLQLSALPQMFSDRQHSLALHRSSNVLIEALMLTSGAPLHKALPLTNSSYLSSLNSDVYLFSSVTMALLRNRLCSLLVNVLQAERHSEPGVHLAGFPFFKDWYCLWSNPQK